MPAKTDATADLNARNENISLAGLMATLAVTNLAIFTVVSQYLS
jgi:hypothetical protein